MDLKQIQELIRFVAKAGVSEVQLEQDDFKIVIKTTSGTVMQQAPAPATQVFSIPQPSTQAQQTSAETGRPAESKPAAEAPVGFTEEIKSPMIGTFYRRPSPDKPEFIKVGDKVAKGQVVCVIEAMKLFNEIESDVAGTIVKVLVDDMSPVEYDQPLFLVEP
jgi:acetyl-CoA carboxylase biotin carboxyl carrier protein